MASGFWLISELSLFFKTAKAELAVHRVGNSYTSEEVVASLNWLTAKAQISCGAN